MYALLEMKTGLMETEFRLGFSRLVRAICKALSIQCDTILQTWVRTCIKNDTEQAQICRDSVGIVSKKTILKAHPLVDDANAEIKQLEKEEQEALAKADLYSGAFADKEQTESGGKDGSVSGKADEE